MEVRGQEKEEMVMLTLGSTRAHTYTCTFACTHTHMGAHVYICIRALYITYIHLYAHTYRCSSPFAFLSNGQVSVQVWASDLAYIRADRQAFGHGSTLPRRGKNQSEKCCQQNLRPRPSDAQCL
jgi:hypothetical protein